MRFGGVTSVLDPNRTWGNQLVSATRNTENEVETGRNVTLAMEISAASRQLTEIGKNARAPVLPTAPHLRGALCAKGSGLSSIRLNWRPTCLVLGGLQ